MKYSVLDIVDGVVTKKPFEVNGLYVLRTKANNAGHSIAENCKSDDIVEDFNAFIREAIVNATNCNLSKDFKPQNSRALLLETRMFDCDSYKNGMKLYEGDILIDKHLDFYTVVVDGESRTAIYKEETKQNKQTSLYGKKEYKVR